MVTPIFSASAVLDMAATNATPNTSFFIFSSTLGRPVSPFVTGYIPIAGEAFKSHARTVCRNVGRLTNSMLILKAPAISGVECTEAAKGSNENGPP